MPTFFRVVKTDPPGEADFLSHEARGLVPRDPSREAVRLSRGVSVLDSEERARATARRWPRMGRFIARLDISDEAAVTYERTGASGHYTLWADPTVLLASVTTVVPV